MISIGFLCAFHVQRKSADLEAQRRVELMPSFTEGHGTNVCSTPGSHAYLFHGSIFRRRAPQKKNLTSASFAEHFRIFFEVLSTIVFFFLVGGPCRAVANRENDGFY